MKKSLKKMRNGGFKFCSEVKLTRLMTYLALFSRINLFTWSGHYKELKLIGNLYDCPQILTVGRLTHKQQKRACEFFFRNTFFNERDFCTNTSHFFKYYLITFPKRSITFHCNWVWQNPGTLLSALGPETEEQINVTKDKIRFNL